LKGALVLRILGAIIGKNSAAAKGVGNTIVDAFLGNGLNQDLLTTSRKTEFSSLTIKGDFSQYMVPEDE